MSMADRARLVRLRRLEKIRAIAKQTAMAEAAAAESTLGQLLRLSERTRNLAGEYGNRRNAAHGGDLLQQRHFISGLTALSRTTENDARRAQSIADAKLQQLAQAERRRAAIEERAQLQARMLAKSAQSPVLGARKGSGTDLE